MTTLDTTPQMDLLVGLRGMACLSMASHGRQAPYNVTPQSETCFKRMCMAHRRKMLRVLLKPYRRSLVLLGVLLALTSTGGITQAAEHPNTFPVYKLGLIPLPRHITAYEARWHIPDAVRIAADNPAQRDVARFLQRFLKHRGIAAKIVATGPAQITLSTTAADTQLGPEGYQLNISSHGAALTANAGHGLFYALQTFEQLFNPAKPSDNAIHEVSITDWPRYRWRGIMLDCVRHFFPVPVVEKFIRVAAHYKLNMFHWHLTDDQGWRIEIPQYPNLTKIGAWRPGSSPLIGPPAKNNGPRYGGYYTDAQISQIVAYAHRRYVTVVPEIDIPGHSWAAIASYPWLAAMPQVDTLSPDARTFKFLTTVFGDLTTLFPSRFIHLGGDEVAQQAWLHNSAAEKLMQQRHWTLDQVHGYFARRLARFLASKGRRAVVWNDVPAEYLPKSAVIECWTWNSSSIVLKDARLGHDVIVANELRLYFNFCQGYRKYEPHAVGLVNTLRQTYNFNPATLLPKTLRQRILGTEACVWTEAITSAHHLFYQILPREMALAEISWTPKKDQHYSDFVKRTARQYLWLQANHYNFRIPPPSLHFTGDSGTSTTVTRIPARNTVEIVTTSPTGSVRITDPVPGAKIYYTRNGLIPDSHSAPYNQAIAVPLTYGKAVVIRSVAIDPSGRSSAPYKLYLNRVAATGHAP